MKDKQEQQEQIVGKFDIDPDSGAIVTLIEGGVAVRPDPNAEPGEWSPFGRDLEAEGWVQIGFIAEDGLVWND